MARSAKQVAAQRKASLASAAKRRKAFNSGAARKASIRNRKVSKAMHVLFTRGDTHPSIKSIERQAKRVTPKQRAARVRKIMGV